MVVAFLAHVRAGRRVGNCKLVNAQVVGESVVEASISE
jgi:hypothetical protein